MQNPVRSEAAAFRFVLLTIAYFALIVTGSLIQVWLGVAVFAVLTAGGLWWALSRRSRAPGRFRLLVVADETVDAAPLLDAVRGRVAGRDARVLVVCPAPGDETRARLADALAAMRAAGLDAVGELGGGDPNGAIEDAARAFRPDELVVSTRPAGQSRLDRSVVEQARERLAVPVTHVVVDRP